VFGAVVYVGSVDGYLYALGGSSQSFSPAPSPTIPEMTPLFAVATSIVAVYASAIFIILLIGSNI